MLVYNYILLILTQKLMSSDEETSTIHYSMEEMEDASMPSPPAHRPPPPVAPAPVPPPPPARPPTEATPSGTIGAVISGIEGGHLADHPLLLHHPSCSRRRRTEVSDWPFLN